MAIVRGRDAAATRGRILEAAAQEFSKFGIAGSRVDRIAANASANKAMLYRYFGSKDELFDAVFTAHVLAFVDAVQFDAADLGEYAGRLFDSYQDQPRTMRLTHWQELERPDAAPIRAIAESNARKLKAIADAQSAGSITSDYPAVDLLAMIRGIAMSWNNLTPDLEHGKSKLRARRRAAIVTAVTALTMGARGGAQQSVHESRG
jgi:AcrR family transcriptional regulator